VTTAPLADVASTEEFAGTVIAGPVVSVTVTVNDLLAEFRCASVAEHVTVVVPRPNVDPLARVQLTATLPSRRSIADAVKLNVAPDALVASTVAFAGTVITGAVVSRTVTVNVLLPVLARVSVALQVTVVVPAGNVDPLAGVQLTATLPSTRSVADAVNVKAAPVGPVASIVAFAGTVTTGAVRSATVTVKLFVCVFAWLSVAVQVTVVAPSGNVAPLAGTQLTTTVPSKMSVADAV
jgi:hypothetical protein